MVLQADEHAVRTTRLYASDVAAAMGLSPYKSPADVYAELTMSMEPSKSSPAMELGNHLEPIVLDWAEGWEHGGPGLGPITRDVGHLHYQHQTLPLGAHLDGIAQDTREIVEAKTSGLLGPPRGNWGELGGGWGEPGTNEIPTEYLVQMHVQMMCRHPDPTGFGESLRAHLVAFIHGKGFVHYVVPMDCDLRRDIAEFATKFWGYVERREPPDDLGTPDIEILKRVRRESKKKIQIDTHCVSQWLQARDEKKHAEKREEETRATLLTELGDADTGLCDLGRITYFRQSRKGVDLVKLHEEFPEVADQVVQTVSYPVLRFKAE